MDAILSLEFNTVESLWREFWRSQYNNNGDECEEEKYLSKYVIKRFLGGYINKKQLLQIKVVFFVLIGAGATVYEAGRPSLLSELDPGFSS